MTENKELYAKLARIIGRLDRLPKKGFNKHFKYEFVTDSDVSDTIRAELAEENIAFFASMVEYAQSNGHTSATFEFTFACGDTGASKTSIWTGESIDKQDKGLSKAATSAEKYFLLKTFLLSTGEKEDDPDNDAPKRTPSNRAKTNAKQPQRTSTPDTETERSPASNQGAYPAIELDDLRADPLWFEAHRAFDIAEGLMSMYIDELPEFDWQKKMYTVAKSLGYANSQHVKDVLGIDSSNDFTGYLGRILIEVLYNAPQTAQA